MKKFLIALIVMLSATFMFADNFDKINNCVKKFMDNGSYIQLVSNATTVAYYPKESLPVCIVREGYSGYTLIITRDLTFDLVDYNFSNDEKGNLIITKK